MIFLSGTRKKSFETGEPIEKWKMTTFDGELIFLYSL
jgi:hypothetical protein